MIQRIRVAGIVRRNQQILLVLQRSRFGGQSWSLPGGRLEPSDVDMYRGVEREVWEETGLRVQAGALRFVSEYLAPDIMALTLIFDCQVLDDQDASEIHLNNTQVDDQIIDVAWWPEAEMRQLTAEMGHTLQLPIFWEALYQSGIPVHLGRHFDDGRPI